MHLCDFSLDATYESIRQSLYAAKSEKIQKFTLNFGLFYGYFQKLQIFKSKPCQIKHSVSPRLRAYSIAQQPLGPVSSFTTQTIENCPINKNGVVKYLTDTFLEKYSSVFNMCIFFVQRKF
eukprot:sb/3476095/